MSGQQIDPVDNVDDDEEEGREEEDRRIAQRRQGNDVEYLKHAENRRRRDRRRRDRRTGAGGGEPLDQTLTNMLNSGPDMDRIIKIVFTRVLFVIAMVIIFYHIAAYFIFPQKLFKGDFKAYKKVKVEDVNR